MTSDHSFEDLVRSEGIEFHTYGRKIETNIGDFGICNRELIKQITDNFGAHTAIKGNGLEEYLRKPENLFYLAEFSALLWYPGIKKFSQNWGINIDVDINNFSHHYQPDQLSNIAKDWTPEIPCFEKVWNLALCSAIGGIVGYPGYEGPRCDESFRYHMAQHAENFMIGTREQIERYKKYALDYLNNINKIVGNLNKNQGIIFDEPHRLQGLKVIVDRARKIAENVTYFSIDFEKAVNQQK